MKKVVMLVTALVAISFLFTVIPNNVESQEKIETTISGTVFDLETEEPIEEAMVRMFTDIQNYFAWTDENGEYEFTLNVIVKEEFDMYVGKGGYYDHWESGWVVRGEDQVIDIYLEPKPTMVYGYITDLDTEEPISWARVELMSTNVDGDDWSLWTDETGYYEIFAEPGDYKIVAGAEGYQRYETDEFSLIDGQELEINVTLEPIRNGVYGMVTNEDGGAIPNAYIRVYQEERGGFFQSTFTDDEGNYEIKAPPGEYIIEVSADEHFDFDDTITIPEEDMLEYNVEMSEISVTGVLKYVVDFIMEIIGGIF